MAAKLKDGRPKASHLVTTSDNPSDWHLPVKGPDGKPDHGLMGAAHAALTKGYRGNKYSGPGKSAALARLKSLYKREGMDWPGDGGGSSDNDDDDGKKKATMAHITHATFTLPGAATAEDEEYVTRSGLLFKTGEYTAGNGVAYSMTPDELRAAAANFSGSAPNELEHINSNSIKTFLDGKLGQVEAVWTSDDGTELYGDVVVPKWIDTHWGAFGRKCSTVWDTESKQLQRLGLCLNPVVEEAALVADYATFATRHDTRSGQSRLQMIHDEAARAGAVCSPKNLGSSGDVTTGLIFANPSEAHVETVKEVIAVFASRHESVAIQHIHDHAVEHGATCEGGANGRAMYAQGQSSGEGDKPMPQQTDNAASAAINALLAIAKGETPNGGAPNPNMSPNPTPAAAAPATTAAAGGHDTAQLAKMIDDAVAAKVATFTSEIEALKKENQQLKASDAEAREKRWEAEGAQFADGLIAASKALPKAREAVIAQYVQAARDDQHGLATFANADGTTKQVSRLEQLAAFFGAVEPHTLTSEQIATMATGGYAPNGTQSAPVPGDQTNGGKPMDATKKIRLLNMTGVGKAALAAQQSNGNGKS